ncbi:hypothetical protein KHA80_04695 [Anaerobacillus sp. HL2]|nr:hypothetical protein KHA80_04695 [Anaerobacillus sp. HL2]
MKKIAITLSTATLLMGALLGCGANQDNGVGGLGTADQRGLVIMQQMEIMGIQVNVLVKAQSLICLHEMTVEVQEALGREGRHPATGFSRSEEYTTSVWDD